MLDAMSESDNNISDIDSSNQKGQLAGVNSLHPLQSKNSVIVSDIKRIVLKSSKENADFTTQTPEAEKKISNVSLMNLKNERGSEIKSFKNIETLTVKQRWRVVKIAFRFIYRMKRTSVRRINNLESLNIDMKEYKILKDSLNIENKRKSKDGTTVPVSDNVSIKLMKISEIMEENPENFEEEERFTKLMEIVKDNNQNKQLYEYAGEGSISAIQRLESYIAKDISTYDKKYSPWK
jgi:hypothetical protein